MENNSKRNSRFPKGCFTVHKNKITCPYCSDPDCHRAVLLEADSSEFHTDQLAEATHSINKILSEIQPQSEHQGLAFIQTKMGIMLSWVTHEDGDGVGVTSKDDNETLAKALKLKNYRSET